MSIDLTAVDCAALYERKRRELVTWLAGLPADALATPVPATPGWTVHDVVAHTVGLAADLNAERFPDPDDVDGDRWTSAQVEQRRSRTLGDLAAEWDAEGPRFAAGLRQFGYEISRHFVGDLETHVQDVRSALQAGPDPDMTAVRVALDHYVAALDERLGREDNGRDGALELRFDGERVVAGHGPIAASVAASPFELMRALSGRRSLRQLTTLEWAGDAERFAARLSAYRIPDDDVVD
jgi:uncharacterized protein (TIGR03083 family)